MVLALAVILALPSFTIRADHAVGPLRVGSATPAQAIAAYGAPSALRRQGTTCTSRWPAIALSLGFLSFDANPCSAGVLVHAVVTGRRWRTNRGLRIGDSRARLRALYPGATAHRDGWWLVTRHACAEVGGQAFPGLLARTAHRRVAGFVVTAGVCD
jgi:hypothetical protein